MTFMKQAINSAIRAKNHEDVPIGAVIVRNGEIIARGENMVQKRKNPTLHAEIVAISRACKKLGAKFLDDCDIYVTLEPCAMCATAISLARIRNVYYAAPDIKGGGIVNNARVSNNCRFSLLILSTNARSFVPVVAIPSNTVWSVRYPPNRRPAQHAAYSTQQ